MIRLNTDRQQDCSQKDQAHGQKAAPAVTTMLTYNDRISFVAMFLKFSSYLMGRLSQGFLILATQKMDFVD